MSQSPTYHQEYIAPAALDWINDQPFSKQYEDIYYTADGTDEVHRIYLKPSALLERKDLGACINVGELGFGSGLNFAITATELLQQTDKHLHFISFEAHPLDYEAWQKIAPTRASLQIYRVLADNPPPLLTGWHRRSFANGRVQLSVYHGNALDGLQDLAKRQRQPVDAWFLDGFSPPKNPDMWDLNILSAIADNSTQGTTVGSFTSAGAVRRGLEALGFAMRKVDQQPIKRSSLAGTLVANGAKQRQSTPQRVSVFGAGIAGCTVARHLADQGVQVQMFDPNGVASGGSKMDVSALHCRLLGDSSPGAEFRARAFHYARSYHPNFPGFSATGAVQLAMNDGELSKIRRIAKVYAPDSSATQNWLTYLDEQTLTDDFQLAGLGALVFPSAAIIDLPQLCHGLMDHPNIEFVKQPGVETDQQPFIVACAGASKNFANTQSLEIGEMYGQLDWIKPVTQARIPMPIVGNGYVIPGDKEWTVGSSYEYEPWTSVEASTSNINKNRRFIGNGKMTSLRHKRAPRCVSSDREPVVGKLSDMGWISTAHGSMGTSSAPMAAAMISSQLLGWIAPVSQRVETNLSPQRFIARQARRGVKHVGPKPD